MVVVGVLRQYPWQRRYDCRSGSLPEILQYRVWLVSRTETFNTQVHWPNLQRRDIEPNHPSEINPNSDSRSRSDGRSRRFVQYRVDQSQGPPDQVSRFYYSPYYVQNCNWKVFKIIWHRGIRLTVWDWSYRDRCDRPTHSTPKFSF